MNVRIAQLLSFNAASWFDGAVEMNQYTVKLWMITQSEDSLEQNIAFRRMKHFIYGELDSTIFVDSELTDKCKELARAGFNITTLPGDPSDQLIGIMLYHKINAIMENRIRLVEIEISAGDAVVYLHGENETNESLIRPDWWESPDLTHSNLPSGSDNLISIHPTTQWRDLELSWPDSDEANESGNTVVFADFKKSDDTK